MEPFEKYFIVYEKGGFRLWRVNTHPTEVIYAFQRHYYNNKVEEISRERFYYLKEKHGSKS